MNTSVARIQLARVATGVAALGAVTLARADAGVDAITALSAQATLYITAAFGVAVLVAGGFWGIRMMRKAFSKAA